MNIIKKIGIILKEIFLSPKSTSIITEEGPKIIIVQKYKGIKK